MISSPEITGWRMSTWCTREDHDNCVEVGNGPGVVYSGSSDNFPSSLGAAITDPVSGSVATWNSSDQHAYKFQVTLRPLKKDDEKKFHEFFLEVPSEERMFIKHRVTEPDVIRDWCQNIDLGRNLPLDNQSVLFLQNRMLRL